MIFFLSKADIFEENDSAARTDVRTCAEERRNAGVRLSCNVDVLD